MISWQAEKQWYATCTFLLARRFRSVQAEASRNETQRKGLETRLSYVVVQAGGGFSLLFPFPCGDKYSIWVLRL